MRYLVGVAFALCLSACASGPLEETKAFVAAVTAVKGSTDVILDDFNVAERNRFIRERTRSGGLRLRTADEAYYYSTIGEAPATRQFRRALVIIQEYAELLRVLVDGSNAAAIRGQVESLASNVGALLAEPRLKVAVAALGPFIEQLGQAVSIEEARRLALAGELPMRDLIVSLRAAAPAILDEFLSDLQVNKALPQSEINRRVAERRLAVSNYVVLLDRVDATFVRLVRAFERPDNSVTLAGLVKASAELNADVATARKALAAIRGGSS